MRKAGSPFHSSKTVPFERQILFFILLQFWELFFYTLQKNKGGDGKRQGSMNGLLPLPFLMAGSWSRHLLFFNQVGELPHFFAFFPH